MGAVLLRVAFAAAWLLAATLASAPAEARESVAFDADYRPGTVVVKTSERRLYLVTRHGQAIRYTVAVGKAGKAWQGRTRIVRKVRNPTWGAPDLVLADYPNMPKLIPPGPRNPLGVAALALAHGDYAIHGTNRPDSIGKAVSYGCIRMSNADITDLFDRVRTGTPVVVLP